MKPYVICHSMSSVDGRIVSKSWGLDRAANMFEGPAAKIKVDAWIVGRRTMQEFSSRRAIRLPRPDRRIDKKSDFVGRYDAKTFAVAIDPSGKCRWDTNMTTTEHVIEVLTERVSIAYLTHLREKQVSYVIAGAREIDLETALEKLNRLFGVKRCRIDGGGTVNGSFLKAGLIDEVSHVVVPIADGALGTPTMFDAEPTFPKRRATRLELKPVSRLAGGALWVRYRVARSRGRAT